MKNGYASSEIEIQKIGFYVYFLGLITYFSSTMLLSSTYNMVLDKGIQSFMKLVPLFLLGLAIALKSKIKGIGLPLLFIACLVCSLITYRQSGSIAMLAIVLLVFASANVAIQSISTCLQFTIIITAIVIILSSLLGLIPNVYRPDMYGLCSYDLGFGYASQIGYYIEAILVCQLLKTRGKISYIQTMVYTIMALCYFALWRFSSQTLIILAIVIVATILHNYKKTTFIQIFSVGFYPVLGFGYLLFNYFYTTRISWMDRLNTLLTWRLGLGHSALHNYGVSIFGSKVSFSGFGVGSDTKLFNAGGRATITGMENYDFVDSSYLLVPIIFGIVWFCILLIGYAFLLYSFNKLRYGVLFATLVLIGVQCCINPLLYQVNLNPFIIFLIPFIQESQQRRRYV